MIYRLRGKGQLCRKGDGRRICTGIGRRPCAVGYLQFKGGWSPAVCRVSKSTYTPVFHSVIDEAAPRSPFEEATVRPCIECKGNRCGCALAGKCTAVGYGNGQIGAFRKTRGLDNGWCAKGTADSPIFHLNVCRNGHLIRRFWDNNGNCGGLRRGAHGHSEGNSNGKKKRDLLSHITSPPSAI